MLWNECGREVKGCNEEGSEGKEKEVGDRHY